MASRRKGWTIATSRRISSPKSLRPRPQRRTGTMDMTTSPESTIVIGNDAGDTFQPDTNSPALTTDHLSVSDGQRPPQRTSQGPRFEDALQLISTCQRCKRRRKKCDRKLPSCASCQKAEVECTFYDHWLGQELPRRYAEGKMVGDIY